MRTFGPLILTAAIGLTLLGGDAPDPSIGTWTLNIAKSQYVPGPAPKSQTRIYERTADGIKETIRTEGADGEKTTVILPVIYDGRDYPVTGSSQYDTVAMSRVSSDATEVTLMHAGNVLAKARREISGDQMVITVKSGDPSNQTLIRAIYDRVVQKPVLTSK
jgi:hypothetical protein